MVSLPGNLFKKQFPGVVEVKPELCWKPQEVEDAKAVGCLQSIVADWELKQPRREMYIAGSKAGGREPVKPLTTDMELQDLTFDLLVQYCLTLVQYFLTVPPTCYLE